MIILFKTGKGKKDMNELDFNKDYRYILRISILPGMHENERSRSTHGSKKIIFCGKNFKKIR